MSPIRMQRRCPLVACQQNHTSTQTGATASQLSHSMDGGWGKSSSRRRESAMVGQGDVRLAPPQRQSFRVPGALMSMVLAVLKAAEIKFGTLSFCCLSQYRLLQLLWLVHAAMTCPKTLCPFLFLCPWHVKPPTGLILILANGPHCAGHLLQCHTCSHGTRIHEQPEGPENSHDD